MKTKLITGACVLALTLSSTTPCLASEETDPMAVTLDVIVARPFCLLATICGAAVFVVSLPVAAPTRSVRRVGDVLVVKPAKATFARPLGDLSALSASY